MFYNVCTFYTYTTRAYTYLLSSFITDHVAETTLTKSPNVPTLRYEHNPFALLKDFFFFGKELPLHILVAQLAAVAAILILQSFIEPI